MRLFLVLLLLAGSSSSWSLIQSKEKFEWGLGLLSIRGPHYRSSDQAKNFFYPLPYFVYQSDKIEAEPSFIRGTFIKNEWFSLKLGVMIGLNVESGENKAREGMPDIDHTFEVGPLAIFKLWNNLNNSKRLTFESSFRKVVATDLKSIESVGYYSIAYINYISTASKSNYNWGHEISLGPMWGDKRYHNFFFGVSPDFATDSRKKYDSKSGYSGFQLSLVLNRRIKKFVFVPFLRWDYLKQAAFENSPLYRKRNYLITGLASFWLF